MLYFFFFFQAEDGIRYLVRSRGLGDVYKRQALRHEAFKTFHNSIKEVILIEADNFKKQYGYTPPYWRLLEFARNQIKNHKS